MDYPKSKVYVKVDDQNRIIRIDGGYTISNIKDPENWVLIDEGYGDRYNLCQGNYLDGPLYTIDSVPRYKLIDNILTLRSEEEIQVDIDNISKNIKKENLLENMAQLVEEVYLSDLDIMEK